MLFQKAAVVLLGLAAFTEAISIREEARLLRRQNRNGKNNGGNGGNNNAAATNTANTKSNNGGSNNAAATATCLNANAIQTGSQSDGQNPPVDGQAASATDKANFVNFCSGETLTNGLQVKAGSCNGIVMGKIPSTSNMVSSIIVSPKPAENIAANKDFTISVQTSGLTAGYFTNAAATYYAAPQDLASNGQIIGHTHVTVQDMGNSLTPSKALDPNAFVFFKGINDAGNGRGLLSATVTGGLPAGNYRVCTMSSSSNHQPVLMPIAQRGAQDDCQKFTVGGNGATASGSNTASGSSAASGSGSSNNSGGSAASSKAATTSAKATATKAAKGKAAIAASSSAASESASTSSSSLDSTSGALGGITAPSVTNTGDSSRPFSVNGNTFANQAAAQQRACAIQNNACSDAVNNGQASGFTVGDCAAQETACNEV